MNHCTKDQLIAFERRIADLWEAGDLPFLIHLSGGNEDQLIGIFEHVNPGDWIFSTHRSHYHYLLAGGGTDKLEAMIRRGDSMFVFEQPKYHRETDHHNWYECHQCAREWLEKYPDSKKEWEESFHQSPETHFLTSSVLAGTCCIAAGVAMALKAEGSKNRVWCFVGDGAEDNGHLYEAVNFVEGHELPCFFVIEDNNRSVDTDIEVRRGKGTNPKQRWDDYGCVMRYQYTPTFPHAGSGCKHQIKFKDIKPL